MSWTYRLHGVFDLELVGERIQLKIERESTRPLEFAQFEALELANALSQASQEISYRKAFGQERDRLTKVPH